MWGAGRNNFLILEFDLNVTVANVSDGKFMVRHCPSISGCRAALINPDGEPRFFINENFTTTIKVPRNKNIFLDYLMVVPYDLYNIHVLEEQNLDRTREFISTCGNNHFYIDTSVDGTMFPNQIHVCNVLQCILQVFARIQFFL